MSTFPKCERCSCPNVPPETVLFVIDTKRDDWGRSGFWTFWWNAGRNGTTEVQRGVEVVLCGHQGQRSFCNVEQHEAEARRRGNRTVVVERRA